MLIAALATFPEGVMNPKPASFGVGSRPDARTNLPIGERGMIEAINAVSPFYKGLVIGLMIGANAGVIILCLLAIGRGDEG